MRTRRVLIAALATMAIGGATIATAGTGSADAAPEVPWYQRPATVGTGFSELQGVLTTDLVSASGRWIVVNGTVFGPGEPSSTTYLRDRWTDTTTVIAADGGAEAISAGGRYVAGRSNDGDGWIYEIGTGQMSEFPRPSAVIGVEFLGINDDGYFIVTDRGSALPPAESLNGAGRILPDGTVTAVTPSAAAEEEFFHLTPSLQYAVTDRGRIDLTTSALLPRPTLLGDLPTNGDTVTANVRSAAISPNGRYVALGYILTRYLDHENIETTHIDLWDTRTGQVTPLASSTGYNDLTPRAVLDDGRVLYYRAVDGQIGDLVLVDAARLDEAPYLVSRTFGGAPAHTTSMIGASTRSTVATDISRALICTNDALSPFDTDSAVDCYLKPFPSSPLAD